MYTGAGWPGHQAHADLVVLSCLLALQGALRLPIMSSAVCGSSTDGLWSQLLQAVSSTLV